MKKVYMYKVTYWFRENTGYWSTKIKIFEYVLPMTDEQLRKDFNALVGTSVEGFVFAKYEEVK